MTTDDSPTCTATTHVFSEDPAEDRCRCGQTAHLARSARPHDRLAAAGFHRVGRLCDAGRRSLWLREELGAVELRAGREGEDAAVRITAENPQYQEISSVLAAARFAAEWEHRGTSLDESFALDRHPASVHRAVEEDEDPHLGSLGPDRPQ